jgi:hypothetical protein
MTDSAVEAHNRHDESECDGPYCLAIGSDVTPHDSRSSSIEERRAHGGALLQVSSRKNLVGYSAIDDVSPTDERNASNVSVQMLSAADSVKSIGLKPPTGNVVITVTEATCGQSIFAPDGTCPAKCPYFAQEDAKEKACYFQCLTATQCGSLNPKEDIADPDLMICRRCQVVGCAVCAKGEGDTCAKCDDGYSLNSDGSCSSEYWKIWGVIFSIAGTIGLFLVAWLLYLQFSPVTNSEGLKEGLAHRSSLKLRVPKSQAAAMRVDSTAVERPLWPVGTNLHYEQVAGAGLTLHMNFQAAIIVWGCALIALWVIFTYFTSPDMLTLGLYPSDTPQQLCSVTLRGKELQGRVLSTKVVFLVLMYLGSLLFNFAFALYQRRQFLLLDDDTSMNDFVAILEGLPPLPGDRPVEDELKKKMENWTGEKVVGVSVCWNYKEVEEDIMDAIDREVGMLEGEPRLPDQATLDAQKGFASAVFSWIDSLFGFVGKLPPEVTAAEEKANVEEMLKTMTTTEVAFVIFESEASRDYAVQVITNGSTNYEGSPITLSHDEAIEPDTVRWNNFKVSSGEFGMKTVIGLIVIVIALLVWCFGFYFPFAYYQASFAKQGTEPPFVAGFIFSMLVVGGNQIMYQLSREVAERVGFRYNDHLESFYIALYTLACVLNLAVDMAMEYFLAYEAAVASKAHTADGRLLEELVGYQDIFESYVMQKALGLRLFAYCFPSTFLIPFLMEPLFAIFFPFHICRLLLRTHPECRGREAEKSMDFFAPMDMGRYGDLLLNVMLSVLIVFFPPGTFLKMMLALVVSHVLIYFYDQYRILRSVPAFDYSSDYIDRLVQILMGLPTAFLAAGIVFKGSCLDELGICLKRYTLVACMAGAFLVTVALQIVMIKTIVPLFDKKDHKCSEDAFAEVAAANASTWFTENPVHCLRSKYYYKHSPPCMYNTRGKEHLMKPNPKIGIYFEQNDRIGEEEYY